MKQYAVIVAGGSGSRMGGGIPKQFRSLCGKPVLWWTIRAFHDQDPDTSIIVVLPKDFIGLWEDFYTSLPQDLQYPHRIVAGGASRSESVKNGLELVEEEESLVAIHDGARPLVARSVIEEGWATAHKEKAAIPVVAVVDSLREIEGERSHNVDRDKFRAVQTPQVFLASLLKEAYRKAGSRSFSDDASVVEAAGHEIALFPGSHENIKITNPLDMAIAELIINREGKV